jgi:signal transduction histidine kinase
MIDLTSLEALQELIERSRSVSSEDDLQSFLSRTAEAIASCLGFKAVVINLYRPAWDDFVVTTCLASDPASKVLLGTTNRLSDFAPLLDERFNHFGAYLVRMPAEASGLRAVYVPDLPLVEDPKIWGPTDWLLIPMRHSSGELLGIVSVDEPTSGRVPSESELQLLAAFTTTAAAAVKSAQQAAADVQHRRALEHLLDVSTRLGRAEGLDVLLQAVCDGIATALGFERVAVSLVEPESGLLRARAATGWNLADPVFDVPYTLEAIVPLLDPQFELAGCYLLTSEQASARVPERLVGYRSARNARGPRAWNHHWLLVPLYGPSGSVIGIIWADDPVDYLLPSRDKLTALRLFANQAASAIESHERRRELTDAHAMRQRLLKQIVEAAESERTRIAADLHDGPIQRLTALSMRLEIARMATGRKDAHRAREAIDDVQSQVSQEIERLRRLMSELRPPALDERGLLDALRDYAHTMESATGLEVVVEGGGNGLEDLSPSIETVLYRIVQEAMTNVVRHANARAARIRVLNGDGSVRVEVVDDGRGFDPRRVADAYDHFGLAGMRERAEMAGGTFEVESRPGEGTTVRAIVPLDPRTDPGPEPERE